MKYFEMLPKALLRSEFQRHFETNTTAATCSTLSTPFPNAELWLSFRPTTVLLFYRVYSQKSLKDVSKSADVH